MSNHTPGPWLFRGKSNSVYTAPPEGTVYSYGSIIFGFDDVAEPTDADLNLVLAAPDLLEALECFVNDIIPNDPNDKLWVEARAAIAKAKGGK